MTELNLSHLPRLLRMSKSLVFVPDRATAKVVRKVCHSLGLPQWVSGEEDSARVLGFERGLENFATIAVVPAMTHGWHSLAEQLIWIGPVPKFDGPPGDWMNFNQALCRAPRAPEIIYIENHGVPA